MILVLLLEFYSDIGVVFVVVVDEVVVVVVVVIVLGGEKTIFRVHCKN